MSMMDTFIEWTVSAIWTTGGIAATGLAALYFFQGNLLYFPQMPAGSRDPTQMIKPQTFGLDAEEVWITSEDGVKIHAWLLWTDMAKRHAAPTFVYFHGNAGNISHRLPNTVPFTKSIGGNVLLVSYRGYGLSEGWPTEEGLRMDGRAALRYALDREDLHPGKIVLYGRSLGGAVALGTAAENDLRDRVMGVIVENTYTSIPDMVEVVMPKLTWAKPLISNKWMTIESIGEIERPILFLSGTEDELVPPSQMWKLHEAAESSVKRVWAPMKGGKHNDTPTIRGYWEALAKFVKTLEAVADPRANNVGRSEDDDDGYVDLGDTQAAGAGVSIPVWGRE